MMRSVAVACLVVAGCLLLAATVTAAPTDKSLTIAGRIEADPAILPYIFLHVIDGRTGAVIRSASADGTGAFSMWSLPTTVSEVRAKVQLPSDQYNLNETASVLSVPVSTASSKLVLKVATSTPGKNAAVSAPAAVPPSASLLSGVVTLGVLVVAWCARHALTNLLDLPAFKPPKPRKVMVTR